MGTKRKISKEDAEKIVKECFTIADFCRKVGWQPRGDNYKIFHSYVKEYNLDTSHFTGGNNTNFGNKNNKEKEKSVEEYIKNDIVRGTTLLKKLIKEGIKERKCECCGNDKWLGEDIPLEIHHKDGNHYNNNLENIMLLCPNCHARTDTYKSKKLRKDKFCKYCGAKVSKWSRTYICVDCAKKKQRKVERPSREVLEEKVNKNSISSIAREYNVSFRTIKKWMKAYDIIKN